jgi:hypothetical protein
MLQQPAYERTQVDEGKYRGHLMNETTGLEVRLEPNHPE